MLSLLVVSLISGVRANDTGIGVGVDIETEDFEPLVFMCDERIVLDDSTEPGRLFNDPTACPDLDGDGVAADCFLFERLYNYAFEGEQVYWRVLVIDKNGFEKINDVYGTIGSSQGAGNDIEVNCQFDERAFTIDPSCNARIDEEELSGDWSEEGGYWDCLFTVETPDSMYGEYWVTIEAEDNDGLLGTMAENDYWFFNPFIALSVDGDLTFEDVRPGTSSYSSTLLLGNDADDGSGVMMDMFISGTDFYDSSSSGAACPITNQLLLGDGNSDCDVGTEFGGTDTSTDPFCYYASHGAYSTSSVDARADTEGYVGINYGIGFNNPHPFYGAFNGDEDGFEIIQGPQLGPYFPANTLSPGSELAVTFRLNLPQPCNGDFDTGSLYFWGEAI